MLLVCYRHGFRASEICDLRWSQIDFDHARLAVRRSKRGTLRRAAIGLQQEIVSVEAVRPLTCAQRF
jgi:integrase